MTETGVLLGTMPPEENPYITSLLPVAYLDDLVMHAILALSGTHLGFKQKLNVEVHGATSRHYDLVLRGLQRAIDNLDLSDSRRIVRILLVLLILCTFEVGAAALKPEPKADMSTRQSRAIPIVAYSSISERAIS